MTPVLPGRSRSPREFSDRVLAARTAAGDDDAFAQLAARHRPALLRFARSRLVGREDHADDAVQEGLIRALRSLRRGSTPEDPRAWLYVIVRNCCADVRRSGTVSAELTEDAMPIAPDVADVVASGDRLDRVVDAIGRLPQSQRSVLVEREFEGSSYEQLAARHDTTVGAVKSLLVRARRNLAAQPGLRSLVLPALWLQRRLAGTGVRADALLSRAAELVIGPQTATVATMALAVASGVPATQLPPELSERAAVAPPAAAIASPPATKAQAGTTQKQPLALAAATGPTAGRERGADSRSDDPAAVLRDCGKGEIDPSRFTAGALRQAREQMPTDVAEYTDCSARIGDAQAGALTTG